MPMTAMKIDVLYSCGDCGVVDQVVHVEERPEGLDVCAWLNGSLALAISCDHRERSPYCCAEKMSAVKIPMSGRKYIGGPVLQ